MAIAVTSLPYGLRDVRLTPVNDVDGSLGTPVDLPNAQTFTFSEAEDFEELRGDDGLVAIRGKGATVDWELGAGGISFAAWAVLAGGTVSLTGTTPNQVRSWKKIKTDARPYFKVEGQAISDSGGDFHGILYKARSSDSIDGELTDGTFFITKASGKALPNLTGDLYEFKQNETVTAIP